ncbi:MAG: MBOAT family protein, partial [Pseudomonadota bacterium]
MLFNTPIFFVFFVVFLLIYGLILTEKRPRVYFILVASLVFYGAWNYTFIPLLVGSSVIDYYLALAIGAAATQQRKKLLVTASVIVNLGILALFKYADFALASVADFLTLFGVEASLPTLSWVLPVGISFYTFQSMSYTIDVYRGDMQPRRGLVHFTSALAFFPQLVAGPILRARQILPQFHSLPIPTWDGARHGMLLVTSGLIKKTIADLLAIPAAVLFEAEGPVSMLEAWTGTLAFAGQIYGDFAGYTDMAIGIALIIGFKIPPNFNLPYFAVSPVDFWRRWH